MAKRVAKGATYKAAGVDIDAGAAFVEAIARLQHKTFGPRVIELKNGFAGLFALDHDSKLLARNYRQPVLVAGTDSTGTKMLLALELGKLDTIGIDLVAMSINDLIVTGAEPLFFLDCISTSKVDKSQLVELMKGIAEGCVRSGCALLGGETAELPGFYRPGELDAVGFGVGVVEKRRIIDGRSIESGDLILGVGSNGLHSNGYSLVRHLLAKKKPNFDRDVAGFGCTLGEELLKPTAIYVEAVRNVLRGYKVKRIIRGMAHITGGGLIENLPRIFPAGLYPKINSKAWTVPPIFKYLQKIGRIETEEMYRVFNMGVGLVMVCPAFNADAVIRRVEQSGHWCRPIGVVARGKKGTVLR